MDHMFKMKISFKALTGVFPDERTSKFVDLFDKEATDKLWDSVRASDRYEISCFLSSTLDEDYRERGDCIQVSVRRS